MQVRFVPHDDKYAWFRVMPQSSQKEEGDIVSYIVYVIVCSRRNVDYYFVDYQFDIYNNNNNI